MLLYMFLLWQITSSTCTSSSAAPTQTCIPSPNSKLDTHDRSQPQPSPLHDSSNPFEENLPTPCDSIPLCGSTHSDSTPAGSVGGRATRPASTRAYTGAVPPGAPPARTGRRRMTMLTRNKTIWVAIHLAN